MNPRLARRLARFNRRFTNHLARPLATRLPGFGVVVHTGRRSGRGYRTPVNVFEQPGGGYVIALTYGSNSDWVKNVIEAGRCELVMHGRRHRLVRPEIFHDEARQAVPRVVRVALRRLGVAEFMRLEESRE
jgi:deazaflavin-dependent oxidoreductase (nitroreductase family)